MDQKELFIILLIRKQVDGGKNCTDLTLSFSDWIQIIFRNIIP